MSSTRLPFQTKVPYTAEQQALAQKVTVYKDVQQYTWQEMASRTGIAYQTLQAFAAGTYEGNKANVAADVEKWFKSEENLELFKLEIPLVPPYQPTKTALKIRANLIWARRGNIITIDGDPGVGKSEALVNFLHEFPNAWMVTAAPSRQTYNAIMLAILGAFNVPPGNRTAYQLSELVRRQFANRKDSLLIIDESQHLGERALEELRAIHDDTKVGLAFIGNREVTRNIEGNRTANFAQRFSRVSMRMTISAPERADVAMLLEVWGVQDPREVEYLTAIAMKPGGGALRSMTKCLELASVLAQGENAVRNFDHIRDSWAQLSAGGVA